MDWPSLLLGIRIGSLLWPILEYSGCSSTAEVPWEDFGLSTCPCGLVPDRELL